MRNVFIAAVAAVALTVPATAGENARVTDNEIVIGTYTDLSGVTAMWGVNNTNAWRMVFDEANAEGGINGRKIKYVVEDMQYQVPRAVQAANKLINRDNVFIMVANGGTPMNNATMPEQLAKGVPNIFPLTAARSMYYPLNHMKFGFAASYYDMERGGREAVRREIRQEGDLRHVTGHRLRPRRDGWRARPVEGDEHAACGGDACTSRPTPTSAPRSPSCTTPSAIWCCSAPSCATPCRSSRRSARSGWNVDILGNIAIYDEAVAEVPGGVTEGIYTTTLGASSRNRMIRARRCGSSRRSTRSCSGTRPTSPPRSATRRRNWWCRRCRRRAATSRPTATSPRMESIKGYNDIFGSPTMSFSATKHQGSNEAFLAQVKNGHWVQVGTSRTDRLSLRGGVADASVIAHACGCRVATPSQ